ncbi:VOC family protein [Pedococcus aerophilus]|uniref:VOC family protein n=1 Tax=Pedococcus aerophilus TaxID=436356 RepID=A0ABN3UXY2_9MICO
MTTVTPYLSVHDGSAALAFYVAAFGATVVERFDDGDRLAHATLAVDSATFHVSDEYQDLGAYSPSTLGHATSATVLGVEDPDRTFAAAVGAGATATRPVADDPGGRSGWLVDPFGHRWNIRRA